jgi:hypothetical protein
LTATAIRCYRSVLEGLMQKTALLLVLAVVGCGSDNTTTNPPPPSCRCTNAVPGGTLDLPCGASGCLGGMGYRCLDQDRFEENTTICGFDMSVPPDLTGDDLSLVPDLYGIDLAGALGCNGLSNCLARCGGLTGAARMSCETTCFNNSTANAQTLYNNYLTCLIDAAVPLCTSAVDGGTPPCNATDVDALTNPNTTNTASMGCVTCVQSQLSGVRSHCTAQATACINDKP